MKNQSNPYYSAFLIFLFLILQSCAPVFSELQTAKTVGENNIEVLPSYTSVSFNEDGESAKVQNQIGLQVAYGITNNIDVRARYERIWIPDEEVGINIFGIGPKFGIVKNKFSFYLPIGRAFGEETSETWQVHPTALITLPVVKEKIDVTLSPKMLLLFCEDCENFGAVNLGFSLSKDLSKWAVRPEYGVLFNPGESGFYGQFSLGFSYIFGNDKDNNISRD